MNKVILMGRLTRDAQTRYTEGAEPMAISRFTLAVDRRVQRDQEGQSADFISCVAFGKTGQFMEKYGQQGTKFVIEGRIQTGSYTNKEVARFTQRKLLRNRSSLRKVKRQQATTSQDHSQHQTAAMVL